MMRPRSRFDKPIKANPEQEYLANNWIRSQEVRLLREDGTGSDIVDTRRAIDMAQSKGLDLITVSNDATPPVCRIYDLSKYVYEQKKLKKEQEKRNRENTIITKEIQLRPGINEHDLLVKQRHANGFLEDGNKVKVVMKFRGREMAFANNGFAVIDRFIQGLENNKTEKEPSLNGNTILAVLAPAKGNKS